MAEVKVKLFANLREAAGTPELLLSGEKIIDVLLSLTDKYPALKDLIFEKSGEKCENPILCGSIVITSYSIHYTKLYEKTDHHNIG